MSSHRNFYFLFSRYFCLPFPTLGKKNSLFPSFFIFYFIFSLFFAISFNPVKASISRRSRWAFPNSWHLTMDFNTLHLVFFGMPTTCSRKCLKDDLTFYFVVDTKKSKCLKFWFVGWFVFCFIKWIYYYSKSSKSCLPLNTRSLCCCVRVNAY